MSVTLTLLAVSFMLIVSLFYLFFRDREDENNNSWLPDGSPDLPSPQFSDRRKEQLDRIFGREDWDFIRSSTSERVQRLFLRERKHIALAWVSELRRQAKAGMHQHVVRVRMSEELEPLLEIKLAVHYYVFLVKCRLIAVIILLGSPIALRGMVGQAESLSEMFGGILNGGLNRKALTQRTGIR